MNNPLFLVFVGGGAGSVLRYLTGRFVPAMIWGTPFPLSILLVNLVATGLLGYVVGWILARSASEELRLLIGVGFCGGLSTFSSFSYDTVILLQNGRLLTAMLNLTLNIVLCLLVAVAGLWLGQKSGILL